MRHPKSANIALKYFAFFGSSTRHSILGHGAPPWPTRSPGTQPQNRTKHNQRDSQRPNIGSGCAFCVTLRSGSLPKWGSAPPTRVLGSVVWAAWPKVLLGVGFRPCRFLSGTKQLVILGVPLTNSWFLQRPKLSQVVCWVRGGPLCILCAGKLGPKCALRHQNPVRFCPSGPPRALKCFSALRPP